jgi:hypothetical protein
VTAADATALPAAGGTAATACGAADFGAAAFFTAGAEDPADGQKNHAATSASRHNNTKITLRIN